MVTTDVMTSGHGGIPASDAGETTPNHRPPLVGFEIHDPGRGTPTGVLTRHLRYLGAQANAVRADRGPWQIASLEAGLPAGASMTCHISWAGGLTDGLVDETTVQAACGLMAVHGRRYGRPTPLALEFASTASGVIAAQGVLAGLIGRWRGLPTHAVHTSVAQAALVSISQHLAAATAADGDDTTGDRFEGREHAPPYQSVDGIWFEIEALDPQPWTRFWQSLDADPAAISRGWRPFLLRYARAIAPLPDDLADTATRYTFAELCRVAQSTGMAICRVRTPQERRADRDVLCNGRVTAPWEITPSESGALEQCTLSRPPPALPLSGMCAVECTRRVQGPLAAHLLRLLGADVIRIEQPGGDPLRGMSPMAADTSARFSALNRGKRVVEIDIKTSAGRREVLDLVSRADVFLHNWAPGKAQRFGLASDDMFAVKANLVYAYASGWGRTPPDHASPGTDFMIQAHSGLSSAMGDANRPVTSLMTLCDVMGGLISAEGVLAGLLARVRFGTGQTVDTSLMSAASVLQYDMLEGDVHVPPERPGSPPVLSTRAWQTGAGWLAISAATPTLTERVRRALRLPDGISPEGIATALHDRCERTTARDLQRVLRNAGVPAQIICDQLPAVLDHRGAADLLDHDHCAFVRSPWRFCS
jgi:crotonobetainyl-CoA:carnitine CoA-transferase CaiB-like acyl-CoA transferase